MQEYIDPITRLHQYYCRLSQEELAQEIIKLQSQEFQIEVTLKNVNGKAKHENEIRKDVVSQKLSVARGYVL